MPDNLHITVSKDDDRDRVLAAFRAHFTRYFSSSELDRPLISAVLILSFVKKFFEWIEDEALWNFSVFWLLLIS